MTDLARRGFLLGAAASLVAAPAIVQACNLMPVRGIVMDVPQWPKPKSLLSLSGHGFTVGDFYWLAQGQDGGCAIYRVTAVSKENIAAVEPV